MNIKQNVMLMFGGISGEYDVSLKSVSSIYSHINKEKYNIYIVGITREGQWIHYDGGIDNILNDTWMNYGVEGTEINLIPVKGKQVGLTLSNGKHIDIDVIFPVLHGPYGEDGKIQGLFEISKIPYVGCGVLASSVGMDKLVCKNVFSQIGLPQVSYTYTTKYMFDINRENELNKIESKLNYPIFIKPANMGSSVGISKAVDRETLLSGIEEALKYDSRIVIEQGVNVREIEVAVLGNEEVKASIAGEIIPAKDFYDYNDKYIDGASVIQIPAKIEDNIMDRIRAMAIKAYTGIDAKGLSRVDFFIDKDNGNIYINEINTLPGFTNISMYPQMWESSGLSYSELIDELIVLARNK